MKSLPNSPFSNSNYGTPTMLSLVASKPLPDTPSHTINSNGSDNFHEENTGMNTGSKPSSLKLDSDLSLKIDTSNDTAYATVPERRLSMKNALSWITGSQSDTNLITEAPPLEEPKKRNIKKPDRLKLLESLKNGEISEQTLNLKPMSPALDESNMPLPSPTRSSIYFQNSRASMDLPPKPNFDPSPLMRDLKLNGKDKSEEEITWVFAQMTGSFSIDGSFIKSNAFESLKSKVMYRPANMNGMGNIGGGGSLGVVSEDTSNTSKSETKNLPIYGTPPTILCTDLKIPTGESKTYRYEVFLPSNLPPSHRGKVIRFTYKLVIGIQRGGVHQKSQIIQIPFRLFGRVEEDGTRHAFDVLKPVVNTKDESIVVNEDEENLYSYPMRNGLYSEERPSSMQNIINICQSIGRGTYEICKNNEHVGKLILTRNSYRLGESITGIIDFSGSSIPCFQVSVYLETSEQIEPSFATRSKQLVTKMTRKVVSEFHKHTLNTSRLSLSLSIPSISTPEFHTSAVSVQWCLRVQFVTGVREKLHQVSSSDLHFTHYTAVPVAEVEAFDCVIPITVYGSGPAGTRQQSVASFAALGTAAAAHANKERKSVMDKRALVMQYDVLPFKKINLKTAWNKIAKSRTNSWDASNHFGSSFLAGGYKRPRFSEGPCLPSNNEYTMSGKRNFTRWKEEEILQARRDWQDFMEYEMPKKYQTYEDALKIAKIKGLGGSVNRGIVMTMMESQVLYIITSIKILRGYGCFLPIEIWTFAGDMHEETMAPILKLSLPNSPITFREAEDPRNYIPLERGDEESGLAYHVKVAAMVNSGFENVLFMDADTFALQNPEFLFDSEEYKNEGDLFWVDYWKTHTDNPVWKWMDLPCVDEWEQESGMMVINRKRSWKALHLLYYISRNNEIRLFHEFLLGDKDLFRFTWRKTSTPYYFIPHYLAQIGIMTVNRKRQKSFCGMGMIQVDFEGKPLFAHVNVFKRWRPKTQIPKEERGTPFYVQQYVPLDNLTLENWPEGPVPGTLLKWANTRGAQVQYRGFPKHRCIDLKSDTRVEGVMRTKELIPIDAFSETFTEDFWEFYGEYIKT
ncbi:hypothetical protein HK098_002677 [Nowakowskiella sp. JEL0407]|nr:hypothetical protein HK098_002677 [Nowakowskiella sp. JEL0407]